MTDSNRGAGQAGRTGQDKGMVDDVRKRAIDAYDSARQTTSDATRRAGDAVEGAPLIALGAGVAVGALLGSLIPATRREREVLSPYGHRVAGAARDAADAARRTGSQKLEELGLTPDAVAEKASEAAKASAEAAASKFRNEATHR